MRVNIEDLERQERVEYRYLKQDILKEAEKRSSYIGKMRGDKDNADFIDRMSLTEGESFLSEEFIADAIEKVYEWLQAFGRDVHIVEVPVLTAADTPPATADVDDLFIDTDDNLLFRRIENGWAEEEASEDAVYITNDTKHRYEYRNEEFRDTTDEIVYILQPRTWWDRKAYSRVERYIKEALVHYILYRWFEYTNLQEVELYFAKYEDYAHQAQLGMNAENGNLERRFNTPFNTIFG